MAYNVRLTNQVKKFAKKLKDKKLKQKLSNVIYQQIALDPHAGVSKTGDLTGIRAIGFKYAKTDYRVAYKILEDETVVIVLLAGSHEGFYQKLKNLI